MKDTTDALRDGILVLRDSVTLFHQMCSVVLQLVPDDQNLPEDIRVVWEACEQAENLRFLAAKDGGWAQVEDGDDEVWTNGVTEHDLMLAQERSMPSFD